MKLLALEFLKLRRTLIWPVALTLPFLPALMDAAVFRNDRFATAPWNQVLLSGVTTWFLLLMPLVISLLISQILHPEHAGGWRLNFAAPLHRTRVLGAKLSLLMILSLLLLLVVLGTVTIGAMTLPGLSNHPDWVGFLSAAFYGWLGSVGMVLLTFFVGLRFSSFLAPLGLGMAGMVIGFVGINSRSFGPWWPWTLPVLASQPPEGFSMVLPYAFSVLLSAVFLALCVREVQRRDA